MDPPTTNEDGIGGREESEETREATNKMISVSSVRQSFASIARLQVMGDIGRLVVSDVRCYVDGISAERDELAD